ncbi:MAG: hypothetical protein GXP55_23570 [Deltaproteobacteria bacterium]|nr:hypothetical protein [Deltaproteobacteria bacterium]
MRPILCLALVSLSLGCSKSTTAPTSPAYGAACDSSTPCDGDLSCIEAAPFPGGYCSALCADSDCPEGGVCVADFGTPVCLGACASAADCTRGQQCWRGSCRPACTTPGQCGGSPARCEAGVCMGPECTADAQCPGGRCVSGRCEATLPDAGPPPDAGGCGGCAGVCLPDGSCAASCSDRGSCGSFDLVCSPVRLDTTGDGEFDAVAAACVNADSTGRFLAGRCSGRIVTSQCESRACYGGQCQEICDDDTDCIAGQRCADLGVPGATEQRFMGCWYPGRGGTVKNQIVDLGEVEVRAGFSSPRMTFGVANDAVSVTLMADQTAGDAVDLSFVNVYDPAEEVLFSLGGISMYEDQPIRWLPIGSGESIAMLIPNSTSDRVTFERGRYSFFVSALSSGASDTRSATLHLYARVKRAMGADVSGGTLNVNVFLVGVGLTEASAPSNRRLSRALAEAERILGAAGISLGTIRYRQITGSAASTLAVIDSSDGPTSELSQLFRLSAGETNNALDLFLVRSISTGAGETGGIALGVAGSIPGPPAVHGTMHSGVVVSFDTGVVGTDYRTVAQIMAHEMSHYLGLYHPTESGRPCAAGELPSATNICSPFGGGDVLADTRRGDGRNLMYYAIGGADGRTYNTQLSAGQGFVLSRSSLVE